MLLPETPFELFRYFGVAPPSFLLGARIDGPDGNAAIYRAAADGMAGRVATTPETFKEVLARMTTVGVSGLDWQTIDDETARTMAEGILGIEAKSNPSAWEEICLALGPALGPISRPLTTEICRLVTASTDLRAQAQAGQIGALRDRIAALDFADTGTVRLVLSRLARLNDPNWIDTAVAPLRVLAVLYLLATWEVAQRRGAPSNFVGLLPAIGPDRQLARPMRRWMMGLKYVAEVPSQNALNHLIAGDNENRIRELKRLWTGGPASYPQFRAIINAVRAADSGKGDYLDALASYAPIVTVFDRLHADSKQIADHLTGYDSLLPFRDYDRLYDLARHRQE